MLGQMNTGYCDDKNKIVAVYIQQEELRQIRSSKKSLKKVEWNQRIKAYSKC